MGTVEVLETPPIMGLTFRCYQGEQDLPGMLDVLRSAGMADQHDEVLESLEDIANKYRHLTNCDPYQDVLVAEVNGQMVAYGRVTWWQNETSSSAGVAPGSTQGERIYSLCCYLRPEWTGKGLEKAFLNRNQERARQIIRRQVGEEQTGEAPFHSACLFEAYSTSLQPEIARLLEEDGFQAFRRGSEMTCSNLQAVPDVPVPEGFEVRPVKPEHYRQIWDALLDAFRDYWGYEQPAENYVTTEEDYLRWQQGPKFQPGLWQVAWEGDQVIGMVLNYITHNPANPEEPSRAWTEDICVRRPWRRRGLARALLARSMRMFCAMGYTKASLGVELNNFHGAPQFYETMGYQLASLFTIYRKPCEPV